MGRKTDARSYLFVPGDRPDRFEKAQGSGADVVVLDLEDAVAAGSKAGAREAVAAWLSTERPAAYVRVNAASTGWLAEDLEAIAGCPGLDGVMLPKAEGAQQIAEVRGYLPEDVGVLALVETALGVWEARAVAEAAGIQRLAFGSVDFMLDADIEGDGKELLYARSRLVLASRVAGLRPPIDGVTTATDDAEKLASDVDDARLMGFGGKLCIHPRQIGAVNRGFVPGEEQVSWARRVLDGLPGEGGGVVQIDGEVVDRPMIERARTIVERAGTAPAPTTPPPPGRRR
ncbi:CoA ester lyase [Rubrobacter marinus]|uniref:CoA ester lyase n=1 Tax=Rubrobacter marinus TaxID=2653852 RepID=A0A6G8PWD3_9ACTN|nr:CoA ester lyase [Rubrobacter marinus]QIN78485.1 CoA ester lyase [Rubrobacter marinus]